MTNFYAVDVLVTGKIRDTRIFLYVMEMFIRCRDNGAFRNIIFSGWKDDIEDNISVIKQLKTAGVRIINNGKALPVRSCGHYWEQLKTLETGLAIIEDGVYVFKTRTDMLFFGGDETVLTIISSHINRFCGSMGFKNKIWIPSFVVMQPFFMADQCYLGLAEDLRKFLYYDAEIEAKGIDIPFFPESKTHPSAASAEIRFWIQPFIDKFSSLKGYRSVWPYSMNGYPHFQQLQDFNLRSPYFQEYLAIYWKILYTVFRVSEGKFLIANSIDANGKVVVRATAPSNNSENFIDDALLATSKFPVSYSTDHGLRKFIEEANSEFYHNIFFPSLERAMDHRCSADYNSGYLSYLDNLKDLACPVTIASQTRSDNPVLDYNYTLYHRDPNRNLANPDVVRLHEFHFQTEDDNADVWRQHRLMEPVLKCMAFAKDERWLTVGDGAYGLESIRMKRKGFKYVLPTDICDTLLKVAKTRGDIDDYRVENAEALSFADESFDYVLCKDSYHHFPRPMLALYEMIRVAKKAVVLIEPQDPWSDFPLLAGPEVIGYESVGNYVYTISRRELEKVAHGLDLPALAFKGIYDHCPEKIETISANPDDPRFQEYLSALETGEQLCKELKFKNNILFAVIFKAAPNQLIVDSFTSVSNGWSIHFFQGNPHRKNQPN